LCKETPNETVEKVPFQKLISTKWEKTIENRHVLRSPKQNLGNVEPEVGDFCAVFSGKGFFDSFNGLRY
jgi:hypothetical protein